MPGLALQFQELNNRTFKRKADMNSSRVPPKPSPRTRSFSTTNSQNSAESWRKDQVRTEDRETCPDCDATCVSKHGTRHDAINAENNGVYPRSRQRTYASRCPPLAFLVLGLTLDVRFASRGWHWQSTRLGCEGSAVQICPSRPIHSKEVPSVIFRDRKCTQGVNEAQGESDSRERCYWSDP